MVGGGWVVVKSDISVNIESQAEQFLDAIASQELFNWSHSVSQSVSQSWSHRVDIRIN